MGAWAEHQLMTILRLTEALSFPLPPQYGI